MRYTVLGFLIDRPMHGYALKRAMSPALPPRQRLNDGILYPLLRRLEEEGLVRKEVERGDGARARNVYHPTDAGRSAFDAWLSSADDERDEVTYDFLLGDPFLTKCLFFDRLAPEEVRAKLDHQLAECARKLDTFGSIRDGMVARGVGSHRIAVLDLGIAQQREKERWLRRMIEQASPRPRAAKAT
jgi:DNA-binding PadR family transcriptional regulator